MAGFDLQQVDGWLVDLNGVLYVGGSAIDGAAAGLEWLRGTGRPCRFVSNTTTRSAASVAEKLGRLGFEIDPGELFTAPRAGAVWLRSQGIKRCHFLVADGIREDEFADFDDAGPGDSEAVVIGDIGESWDYRIMNDAFRHLLGGAVLVALHRAKFSQTEHGLHLDIGPFVKGLEYAAGTEAVVVGKPSPAFYQTAIDAIGGKPGGIVMIGDDIEGDVGGAQQAGMRGVLVRTGKFREDLVRKSDVVPDLVMDSLGALSDAMGG